MTGPLIRSSAHPLIRALDASDAHLFHTLPDPLRVHEALGKARHRPDRKRVALRDGRVVARAARWGGPEDTGPRTVEWFDFADGEEEAAPELLRSAPRQGGLDPAAREEPGGFRPCPSPRVVAHRPHPGR